MKTLLYPLMNVDRMIVNKTRDKVITDGEKICSTLWSKALGLMFQRNVTTPLVFTFSSMRKIPLHMMFVFTPIDVLWLDSKRKVVEMKEGFRPFSYYSPAKTAQYVIELRSSTIHEQGVKVGDEIEF